MFKSGNERQKQIYDHMFQRETKRYPVSYEEWEKEARLTLEDGPFDYVAGGAGTEQTVHANCRSFEKWHIVPKMLRDVSNRDISVSLFNETLQVPFLLAPIGVQSILHPEGDTATAKAASRLNVPFVTSTLSSNSMEAVAAVSENSPKWFQLYWNEDHDINVSLVKRAEKAGYSAIVVTLDTTLVAWRERDLSNAYLPFLMGEGLGNYLSDPVFRARLEQAPEENMEEAVQEWLRIFGDTSVTWNDIAALREETHLPILVKGILDVEDAEKAVHTGVDGIIVSNHGGRQVDGAVAAIDALPGIAEAVPEEMPVLMDSGIRRGSDVLKAISLGADAVLLGRPFVYGLAAGGEEGVDQVIRNLTADIDLTLALSGRTSIDGLDRSLLYECKNI
ncbi:alpha-hydroxy-acid oxidizing protein [Salibacterium sp. K-3]